MIFLPLLQPCFQKTGRFVKFKQRFFFFFYLLEKKVNLPIYTMNLTQKFKSCFKMVQLTYVTLWLHIFRLGLNCDTSSIY